MPSMVPLLSKSKAMFAPVLPKALPKAAKSAPSTVPLLSASPKSRRRVGSFSVLVIARATGSPVASGRRRASRSRRRQLTDVLEGQRDVVELPAPGVTTRPLPMVTTVGGPPAVRVSVTAPGFWKSATSVLRGEGHGDLVMRERCGSPALTATSLTVEHFAQR